MKSIALLSALAIAMAAGPLYAQSGTGVKESTINAAGKGKDAVRNIGHDAKELGAGVVNAGKEAGHGISRVAKDAAHDVGTGFKRDFIQDGAWKGPRGVQPLPGLEQVPH
ncbi:MAG: hypothetical protein EXR39_07490 [Betaproteobacteria bacterium]|nr:hypothetical protein [Betaproteobacteria bacterium]